MPVDVKAAKAIFMTALEKSDPSERAAYVGEACDNDDALRQRVEILLKAHDDPASFMKSPVLRSTWQDRRVAGPVAAAVATVDEPITERPGMVIGPYKLLEQIGEGGFGVVFMAEQTQPVRRKVALKVLKPGMDTHQVIARFEAERQALAIMDHPNIAQVHDGGATESGRPYFVMELVKGIPITEFCDQNQLTPRQRLELFLPICQAVQHAHQKGIIHRDLKPSNVLVSRHDTTPIVKVIDFGVAKALGQQLTDKTLFTGVAQMIGTPLYMSPEQAGMSDLDVDTRSDIYSLGVLLYELLTGTTPFTSARFKTAAYDEIRRIIREEEPPKPSTRMSTVGQAATTASEKRQSDPRKLSRLFRGELDWIVMKALDKDRTRRYETASGLARDIQRYLSDEPVEACPPSATYRLRKFARKHRTGLTTAAAFVVLLAAGAALATWQAVRATRAETLAVQTNGQLDAANTELKTANQDLKAAIDKLELARQAADKAAAAEKQAADKERQASALARARLKEIEKANGLLESIFVGLNPLNEAKGGPMLILKQLRNRLLAVADQLDSKAIGDPLTVARLQNFLGNTLGCLGESGKEIELYQQARQTRAKLLGPDHLDTLITMDNLAGAYRAAGKLDLALPLYEETLKLTKAKFGPDNADTLISMNSLALGYQAAGKLDLALPLFEETLKLRKARLGPNAPLTLTSMNNLAIGYLAAGKPDLAVPLFEETLKRRKAKLGPDDRGTLTYMGNLAKAYLDCKQIEKAIPLFEDFVSRQRQRLGADTLPFAGVLAKVSLALLNARQFPHAEKLLHECLAIREKQEPGLWTTFSTQSMLGGALLGQKKYAEAEPLLLKGYEGMKQREKTIPPQGGGNLRIPQSLDWLIELSTATNKPDEAKKWRAERAKYPAAKKAVAPEK